MSIQMIGIDHKTAVIDVRTVFSFTKKRMTEAFGQIGNVPGINGCVILSTCNRMELWVSAEDEFEGNLYEILCKIKDVPPENYRDYFCFRKGRDAVHHLFRLTGGLESRILGEDQIVTQVGDALSFAREHYAADGVLETLFRQAVTAAKKVKTEITLSATDNSVVRTAIDMLKQQGMSFEKKKCMVIGNGVMGKLAAVQLCEEGADVTVTVRQYRSGVVEIPRGCRRIDYGERMSIFGNCDYVVSATVSPNYTLLAEPVKEAKGSSVVLIDLAVPRDVDPQVRKIPGVKLYDIDCFRKEAAGAEQKAAVAVAEKCFAEQIEEFYDWYEGRNLAPRIQNIKELAAKDMEVRLTKKLARLPVTKEEREELEEDILQASMKAVNKMLFGLRGNVSGRTFLECLDGLEKVYKGAEK